MKIVAVTSCPTGIAHTYMAAEALKIAAEELGYEIKVETQGAVGIEDQLTEKDIGEADAVIIAADKEIDKARFKGRNILIVSTAEAIKDSKSVIADALKQDGESVKTDISINLSEIIKSNYKHLLTGISMMVPFMVAGAVAYSLGIAFSQAGNLKLIGEIVFTLSYPVFSGYIAYSIGNTPGVVPGMTSGLIISYLGGGFIGAAVAGFVCGYIVNIIRRFIKLPKPMEGFMPVFITPVLSTIITGFITILILARPLKWVNNYLIGGIASFNLVPSVLLAVILGIMMAFDMGGPINKAAYIIGLSTVALGKPSGIMASVMAGGMVPPLGMALATVMWRKKFSKEEHIAGRSAWLMGMSFITEGAMPFAARDSGTVLPSIMAGSAVAAALSMFFQCSIASPQGGIFILFIPALVLKPLYYAGALTAGTLVTSVLYGILKK